MTVLAQDDFSGYAPGAGVPAGWTSRWASIGTVSIVADGAALGGQYLRQTAASGARRFLSFDAVPSTTTDCEVLTLVRVGSYLTGSAAALTAISVVLRGSGSSGSESAYKFELNKAAGSGLSSELRFRLSKYVSGADSEITAVPFVWANGGWYWIRARVDGSVLRGSIWALGDTPPTAWTIGDDGSITDASLTTGRAGFKSFDASRTHDVQYIGVSVDGSTVPVPGASTPIQIAVSGTGETTGSAVLTVRRRIAVAGTGETTGAAGLRVRRRLAAQGTGETTGAAAPRVRRRIAASGTGETTGSVVFSDLGPSDRAATWERPALAFAGARAAVALEVAGVAALSVTGGVRATLTLSSALAVVALSAAQQRATVSLTSPAEAP